MVKKPCVKFGISLFLISFILWSLLGSLHRNSASLSEIELKEETIAPKLLLQSQDRLSTMSQKSIHQSQCREIQGQVSKGLKNKQTQLHWKNYYYYQNQKEFNLRLEIDNSDYKLSLFELDSDGLPTLKWAKHLESEKNIEKELKNKKLIASNETHTLNNESTIVRIIDGKISEVSDLNSNTQCHY